jgi:hypothetical protein
MKDIKSALNKINKQEKTIEKIGVFLKTKRGQQFVSKLHTQPFVQLCVMYEAPKFLQLYKNSTKNKNLVLAAINKYNISIPVYTNNNVYTNTWIKTTVRLTKKELREIDARRPKKLGFAARMHAYEEHKLKRFEHKYIPTEKDLQQDLFSEELKTQIKTQLYIHREYVRNFLSRAYYNVEKREPFCRLFMVYENKAIPGAVYEKEGDPYVIGYPFCNCNEKTSINTLKNILRERAKTMRDKDCIELKLYNKYGILLAQCKA